jgi:hypothetical protein
MRLSPWGRVVAISALLVVGGAGALAIGALASTTQRRAVQDVTGNVEGLRFDLGEGDIEIVGGGHRVGVRVERSERYSFGHEPEVEPDVDGTVFGVHSRCPTTLLGPCTVDHRVIVPDNVTLDIRTTSGDVSLNGYRGTARIVTGDGEVDIAGYCGNSLEARAGSGDIDLEAACAPPRMSLRATSGSIHAVLPTGRYDLDAESSSGRESVRGLTPRADAPYSVQVLSQSGDVDVEGQS